MENEESDVQRARTTVQSSPNPGPKDPPPREPSPTERPLPPVGPPPSRLLETCKIARNEDACAHANACAFGLDLRFGSKPPPTNANGPNLRPRCHKARRTQDCRHPGTFTPRSARCLPRNRHPQDFLEPRRIARNEDACAHANACAFGFKPPPTHTNANDPNLHATSAMPQSSADARLPPPQEPSPPRRPLPPKEPPPSRLPEK